MHVPSGFATLLDSGRVAPSSRLQPHCELLGAPGLGPRQLEQVVAQMKVGQEDDSRIAISNAQIALGHQYLNLGVKVARESQGILTTGGTPGVGGGRHGAGLWADNSAAQGLSRGS